MRIRMKATVFGSRDGAATEQFKAGTEHELLHTARERELAKVFVREGWADQVVATNAAPAVPVAPELEPAPAAAPARPPPEGKRRGR